MSAGCFVETDVSRIKMEEKGRFAVVLNVAREQFVKAKVDGCLVGGELAADWVISRSEIGDVVIELKGTDVDHAVKQVRATINYWKEHNLRCGSLAALIVCTRYPRIDTKVQRAKSILARDFGAPLHVVARNCEYEFAALLSARGPFKT